MTGGLVGDIEGASAWVRYAKRSSSREPSSREEIKIPAPYESRRPFGRGRRGFRREPEVIDWNNIQIYPVRKDFYREHPTVESMTRKEETEVLLRNSIHIVKGLEYKPKPVTSFDVAAFPEWMIEELRKRNFQKPTPIQVLAWPAALKGLDVVGISETGSGKTLAYVLPMVIHILAQDQLKPGEGPVGLVLVPTRELCKQVEQEVNSICREGGLVCRGIMGGEDSDRQESELLERCDAIVATPGRLIDLLERKATNLRRTTFVVLDEADGMLSQDHWIAVRRIVSNVRPDRQVLLYSATWPEKIEQLADDLCRDRPIHINVGNIKLCACQNIIQDFERIRAGESKQDKLVEALTKALTADSPEEGMKVLVFCKEKDSVPEIVRHLQAKNLQCEGFCGTMSQEQRNEVLERFRREEDSFPILVCTALLGRGFDFNKVKYVINYDTPNDPVEYIHQIGRTGRAGEKGFAMTFLGDDDLWLASKIKMIFEAQKPPKQPLPKVITEAMGEWTKKMKERRQERDDGGQARVPQEPQADGTHWKGRGRGRRDDFLARCGQKVSAQLLAPSS